MKTVVFSLLSLISGIFHAYFIIVFDKSNLSSSSSISSSSLSSLSSSSPSSTSLHRRHFRRYHRLHRRRQYSILLPQLKLMEKEMWMSSFESSNSPKGIWDRKKKKYFFQFLFSSSFLTLQDPLCLSVVLCFFFLNVEKHWFVFLKFSNAYFSFRFSIYCSVSNSSCL